MKEIFTSKGYKKLADNIAGFITVPKDANLEFIFSQAIPDGLTIIMTNKGYFNNDPKLIIISLVMARIVSRLVSYISPSSSKMSRK